MTFVKKLTPSQAAAMAADRARGWTYARIAEKYGVSATTVGRYVHEERRRPLTPRQLHPCGTIGAYRRHLRAKEPPCVACSAANAGYGVRRRNSWDLDVEGA